MSSITFNYKKATEFFDDKPIMKMILEHCIEKNHYLFQGIQMTRKNKLYDSFDKYFQFACIRTEKKIIGFFFENQYFADEIWAMNLIYIIPIERMKGYCYETLLQYSSLAKAVIANKLIFSIAIKINMKHEDLDTIPFQPNINNNNFDNFFNKDGTMNLLCRGLYKEFF